MRSLCQNCNQLRVSVQSNMRKSCDLIHLWPFSDEHLCILSFGERKITKRFANVNKWNHRLNIEIVCKIGDGDKIDLSLSLSPSFCMPFYCMTDLVCSIGAACLWQTIDVRLTVFNGHGTFTVEREWQKTPPRNENQLQTLSMISPARLSHRLFYLRVLHFVYSVFIVQFNF